MKEKVFPLCILLICFGLYVAPPIRRKEKLEAEKAEELANATAANKDAQDQEYFRYLTQVVQELEKDPHFKEKLSNASEEDLKSGKIADHVDLLNYNVRAKLDEVKRMEVEYQRDLLRKKKNHMSGKERNYWNPIHHENQETFEKDDLAHLLTKHNDMMEERDKKRHKDFKKYELEKEHKRREELKKMSKEERETQEAKKKSPKQHEKLHEPGHKAQLEEVWEKEDGLDPDSFDPKTFFNLHDKNSDGYLDRFELETLFLTDLDKAYNESDPDMDMHERNEDMERMREHVMKNIDSDKDGLVSIEEFMKETMSEDFDKDEEWKPIVDEEQFTDDDITEYERMIAEEEGEVPNEDDFKKEEDEKKDPAKLDMESVEHHEEVIKHKDSDKAHEEEKHEETKLAEKEHKEQDKNAHHNGEKVEESIRLKAKEEVHKEPQEEPKDKGGENVSVTEVDHKTLDGPTDKEVESKEVVKKDADDVRSESETKQEVEKKDEKMVTEDKDKVPDVKHQSEEEKKERVPEEQSPPEEKVEKQASVEEKAPIEAEKMSNKDKEDVKKEEQVQPSSQKEEAQETNKVIENLDTHKETEKETSEERSKEDVESHHDSGKEVIETKEISNENKEEVKKEEAKIQPISQKEEVKETSAERPKENVDGQPDIGNRVKEDDKVETKKESPENDENKNENENKPSEKKVSETTKENVEVQNEAVVT